MDIVFFSKNNGQFNHAGSKARNDIEKIFAENGYHEVRTALDIKNKIIRKFSEYIRYPWICNIRKDNIVIHQYPNLPFFFNFCLKFAKKIRKFKIITVIHDLSIRAKGTRTNNKFLQKYVLGFSDCVIVHNDYMKKYLNANSGIDEKKMIVLGVFDYLSDYTPSNVHKSKKGNIIIAGNLDKEKCGYIYKLKNTTKELKYDLYGPNYIDDISQDNVTYWGSYSPEELPKHLNGAWGLVWDGAETNMCAGQMGQYLKINNPHKTSLYIACGIPVIVWKKAAIAKFVTENKLGIVVDSLYDIESVVNDLSEDEYSDMKENVRIIGKKLRNGEYMLEAVDKAVEKVKG